MNLNREKFIQFVDRKRLKNKTFCIVSNDCWGAEVYHHFGLAYNTPFIGLYLMAPCYIKLLQNLEEYIDKELVFIRHSKYSEVNAYKNRMGKNFPTANIGDIEIQFLHYNSENEAYEKWNRRKLRMNRDNLFFKFDGSKDEATEDLIILFDKLPFKHKICFSNKLLSGVSSLVYCPDWEKDGAKMFRKSIRRFSVTNWLNGLGNRKPSIINNLLR